MSEKPKKSLMEDQRGAIMLVGLFAACSLIGSLWFMVGIGDAIVWKDRVQEATDHAAFTSAVSHARGMNLIAALNLIMFALVAVYVVLGVVQDVIFLLMVAKIACGVAGGICLTPPAAACCAKAVSLYGKWKKVKDFRDKYFKNVIKRFLPPMSTVQTVAGVAYPYVGAAYAWNIGSDYGHVPIALSPSMIPGAAANSGFEAIRRLLPGYNPNNRAKSIWGDKTVDLDARVGLPVKKEKPNKLCELTGRYFLEWLTRLATNIPGIGSIIGNEYVRTILGYVWWTIGNMLMARYCSEGGFSSLSQMLQNKGSGVAGIAGAVVSAISSLFAMVMAETDKFWGEKDKGPKTMWKPGQNGSEWMQVWAFTWSDYQEETGGRNSERHVGQLAGNTRSTWFSGATPTATGGQSLALAGMFSVYMARAEFYFDCTQTWSEDDCNGNLQLSYAAFAMKWRARERRFRMPDIGSMIIGYALEALTSSKILDAFKNKFPTWLGNTKIGQALYKATQNYPIFDRLMGFLVKSKNGKGGLDWLIDDRKGALYRWYRQHYGAVPDTVILH
jgi:hypothetical protein